MLTGQIHLRDPFVLPVADEGRYFLYGTTGANCWDGAPVGFDVWAGDDLEHWEGPFAAFRPEPGFWSDRHYWAPEVHAHGGRYFMLASFKSATACRGTQVLAADNPLGPFRPHSQGPVTPAAWECLDGTLFVDPQNQPWMVFCHEWVQVGDGEMCAVRLAPDLDAAIGPPALLFRASEAPWAAGLEGKRQFVTDGPFLHRSAHGGLLMLWSSFSRTGYTLGIARSASGGILGPWLQEADPLYHDDGGHGMLFTTFAGQLMLAVHRPNGEPNERPIFVAVTEAEGGLALAHLNTPTTANLRLDAVSAAVPAAAAPPGSTRPPEPGPDSVRTRPGAP